MDLLIRGCGGPGINIAMRAAGAGLSVTLIAEDAFEAERLLHAVRRFPEISVRPEKEGVPLTAFALAPLEILPDADLRLALVDPGTPGLEGIAAVHLHDALAEISLAGVGGASASAILHMFDRLGLPVIEAPPGARRFAGLALLDRLAALADLLLLLGAVPWDVDAAMARFGFETGVFAAQDLVGLDQAHARRRAARTRPLLVTDRMVREGRLGRGVGVGWYRYPGGGGAVIDPLMEDMAVEEARFARIARRDLTDDDIIDRLLLGLACLGADLLTSGEVRDEAQIDRLCQAVLGYPTGGDGILGRVRSMERATLHERLRRYGADDAALWNGDALIGLLE